MSDSTAAGKFLSALAGVLEEWGDRWYVFGAQAVMMWGRPRTTGDYDVTAQLMPEDPLRFVEAMEQAGFDLRVKDVQAFVARTRVLPFLHRSTQTPLDVVLAGPGLEEEFIERAVRVQVLGLTVPVISPEDLVITKILAGRPKDIDDVRGILRERSETMDLVRIRETLRSIEQALSQSDLLPAFESLLSAARKDFSVLDQE